MGIYVCDRNNDIYAIKTENQGTVFLITDGIYIIAYVIVIYHIILIKRNAPNFIKNPIIILLFLFINIVLIGGILLYLSGVLICYNDILYKIFSQYIYIFKRSILTIIAYLLSNLLDKIIQHQSIFRYCSISIIVFLILDILMYTIVNILEILEKWRSLALSYNIICDGLVMVIFLFLFYKLIRYMNSISNAKISKSDQMQWYVMVGSLVLFFTLRISYIIFQLLFARELKEVYEKLVLLAIYFGVYKIFTEVAPLLIITWILSKGSYYQKIDEK